MMITEISKASWGEILHIQEEAYTGVPPEEVDVLKSKWEISPESCFVFRADDGNILAYLLAHSWNSLEPPKLFDKTPADSMGDILYLHDLAVSNRARGMGIGKQLAKKLIESAKEKQLDKQCKAKYKKILLVAVQDSSRFWSGLGFCEVLQVPVCSSYGDDAKLMLLNI
jgi:ribosomal protein S18 acetylase RimI-like enzyme